jgi:hypothetical protein
MTYEDKPFPAIGSGLPRSTDRPHVSEIIRGIGQQLGLIPKYDGSNNWDINLAGDIGFMWEMVFTHVLAERMCDFRPGEVEMDGLAGSPDGIGPDPLGVEPAVVMEWKFTWKSSKNLPTGNWAWMSQVKAYCHMLGLRVAVFKICYCMGDYKGSGPSYREARIEFTEQELAQNWAMLVQYEQQPGKGAA